jgi:hypothetical protein
MMNTLMTLVLILATAALCAAQNHMEFFQTTGTTDTGGYSYIGNTAHAGQWLTAGVWVTTGFWANKVELQIYMPDKNTACSGGGGDCALTDTYDVGLRCIAYCPNPGQLVVNIGPQVICSVATSGPGCNSTLLYCNQCPYFNGDIGPTSFHIFNWVQGRTWIAPGIYAEETGSSARVANNWVNAAAEVSTAFQIRLWQTQSSVSDAGQYIQSVGLPQTSTVLPTYNPATQQNSNHVISLSMWSGR